MIQRHYYKLPDLKENQSWCCSNGCGTCHTIESVHERMIEKDKNGKILNAIYEHYFSSSCCHSDLLIWDDGLEEFVDFKETLIECEEK